jgi:hypothetical protein
MERAETLLTPLLKRLGIDEDVRLARVKNDWHSIFDKPLSSHMSPSRLLEGELLLNVDSPIWMQQLGFCKNEILSKLKKYGVRDLRLRVGKVSTKTKDLKGPETSKIKELPAEEVTFLDQLVSAINDDELKGAIRNAAERSFRAKKPRAGQR